MLKTKSKKHPFLEQLDEYEALLVDNVAGDGELSLSINESVKQMVLELFGSMKSEKDHIDYYKTRTCNQIKFNYELKKYYAEMEVFYNGNESLEHDELTKQQLKELKKIASKL